MGEFSEQSSALTLSDFDAGHILCSPTGYADGIDAIALWLACHRRFCVVQL
jgi:hypothetical protein